MPRVAHHHINRDRTALITITPVGFVTQINGDRFLVPLSRRRRERAKPIDVETVGVKLQFISGRVKRNELSTITRAETGAERSVRFDARRRCE